MGRSGLLLCLLPALLLAGIALRSEGAWKPKPKLEDAYVPLVQSSDAGTIIQKLLTIAVAEDGAAQVEALGKALAVNAPKAASVLDELAKAPEADARLLEAELLFHISRGDEADKNAKKNQTTKPQVMETEEVGRRAGALLASADPFVRALAEWAIAARLGADIEGVRKMQWPDPARCDWFARWERISGDALIECDFVRQIVTTGEHRTSKGLLKNAESLIMQAQGVAGRIRHAASSPRQTALDQALARVNAGKKKLDEFALARPSDLTGQRRLWLELRRAVREVALLNPELGSSPLLFATRTGPEVGNITNGAIRDAYGPGSEIYIKNGFSPADPAMPLLNGRLGPGHVRGMDLWWDADRIVFSWVKQSNWDRNEDSLGTNTEHGGSETAHLWELSLATGELKQLTSAKFNSDVEPCYLPNVEIVFASDRSNYGSQCAGTLLQDKMILNLFRCAPDGSAIRWISNNKDFDRFPHVMDNGQLIYLHWGYQERHLWQTHTLWTARPDGAMQDALYKEHITNGPMSLREARQIPGRGQVVAIACGHHTGEVGAVMLADYRCGVNDPTGMRLLTPYASTTEGGYGNRKPVEEGGVRTKGGHYQYPYPLSDKSFLVAYSYKKPESAAARNYGLYYIDDWGNQELIHRDRKLSVAYLAPLRPRPRPPVLQDLHFIASHPKDTDRKVATLYVANANKGLEGTGSGRVKYIRIAQHMPWPCVRDESKACGYNDLHAFPSGAWTNILGAWDWSGARVIGIVPVEADGSAHFQVPVDQPVYFQALDENFLEVRRMRTNVTFQQGEIRGCIGCHESRNNAPPPVNDRTVLAARRPASVPQPVAWGNRDMPNYEKHIQPIFDRYCVSCHGEKSPKAGLEFTSRRVGDYVQSYRTLFGIKPGEPTPIMSADAWTYLHPGEPAPPADKEFFKRVLGNTQPGQLVFLADRLGGAEITPAMQIGSAKSKLVRALLDGPQHKAVKMDQADWVALVTWIDLNAPYFDAYADKEPFTRSGKKQPARWVRVEWPDPWVAAPAGEWVWKNEATVALQGQ